MSLHQGKEGDLCMLCILFFIFVCLVSSDSSEDSSPSSVSPPGSPQHATQMRKRRSSSHVKKHDRDGVSGVRASGGLSWLEVGLVALVITLVSLALNLSVELLALHGYLSHEAHLSIGTLAIVGMVSLNCCSCTQANNETIHKHKVCWSLCR